LTGYENLTAATLGGIHAEWIAPESQFPNP